LEVQNDLEIKLYNQANTSEVENPETTSEHETPEGYDSDPQFHKKSEIDLQKVLKF